MTPNYTRTVGRSSASSLVLQMSSAKKSICVDARQHLLINIYSFKFIILSSITNYINILKLLNNYPSAYIYIDKKCDTLKNKNTIDIYISVLNNLFLQQHYIISNLLTPNIVSPPFLACSLYQQRWYCMP